MERRRFSQVVDEDDLDAVESDIRAWGYPRDLQDGERKGSFFLGYGEDCIFWFNGDGETGLNWHMVIDPKSRGRFTAEEVNVYFNGLDMIGDLLDATHLQAVLRPELTRLRNYCARRGWSENEKGYIRFL